MNKDYVFYINWEDRHKQSYKVGFLARLDESFYLIVKDEKKAKSAYDNGFVGIPGFRPEEVYVSETKMFDFFERRTLTKNSIQQCEELAQTGGFSMVDSFYVEKISEKLCIKYKKVILEAHELQKRKKSLNKKEMKDR